MTDQQPESSVRPEGTEKSNPANISWLVVTISVISILLTLVSVYFAYQNRKLKSELANLKTFDECAAAPGSTIQESFPAVCITADGTHRFTQVLTEEEQKRLQPPDVVSSWKTYTNTVYGFSLKYPDTDGYEVTNEDPRGKSAYILPAGFSSMDSRQRASVSEINIQVLSFPSQPQQTARSIVDSFRAPGYANKRDEQTISVAGTQAIRFMSNNTQAGNGDDEVHTVFPANQAHTFILISVSAQGNTDPYAFPGLLLSTFSFTKSGTPTPTCRPRPACLDATPRCMMPETEDMCPRKAKTAPGTLTCPESGWIDCMPTTDTAGIKYECTPEAQSWFKANCPGFKGAAL